MPFSLIDLFTVKLVGQKVADISESGAQQLSSWPRFLEI